MALHKMVNGIKIDLTPEEEEETLQSWVNGEIKATNRRLAREKEQEMKQNILDKILSKLDLDVNETEVAKTIFNIYKD